MQIWFLWWGSPAFSLLLHPSSSFLITSIYFTGWFFSPPKREELLVSIQSSGSTNGTLLYEIFMTIQSYFWVSEREGVRWGWRTVVILTQTAIQISMVTAPSFRAAALFMHLLALWTWGTDSGKMALNCSVFCNFSPPPPLNTLCFLP